MRHDKHSPFRLVRFSSISWYPKMRIRITESYCWDEYYKIMYMWATSSAWHVADMQVMLVESESFQAMVTTGLRPKAERRCRVVSIFGVFSIAQTLCLVVSTHSLVL